MDMEDSYNLLDMEPDRDSFLFFVSWYKWISTLKKNSQILAFKAICEYCLFSKPIPKEGFSLRDYATLCSFVPIMKKHKANYENGKKGAVHGCKGGRPKLSETPTGLSGKTPMGLKVETPTDTVSVNHTVTEKGTDDVTDNADIRTPDITSLFLEFETELLAIFYFKNNCNPAHELKKFREYYNNKGWKLGRGEVINSIEGLKMAAESWNVKDLVDTGIRQSFMKSWKEVYKIAPDSLKRDVLNIRVLSQGPSQASIRCSDILADWLNQEKKTIEVIFRGSAAYNYKIDWQQTSDEKKKIDKPQAL
jgi:hypothetical protein